MNKLWYICVMDSALQWNDLLIHTATQMNLKITMLSERSKTKSTYCVHLFIQNPRNVYSSIMTESRSVWRWGGQWGLGESVCVHCVDCGDGFIPSLVEDQQLVPWPCWQPVVFATPSRNYWCDDSSDIPAPGQDHQPFPLCSGLHPKLHPKLLPESDPSVCGCWWLSAHALSTHSGHSNKENSSVTEIWYFLFNRMIQWH